jgi:hypothetical protein
MQNEQAGGPKRPPTLELLGQRRHALFEWRKAPVQHAVMEMNPLGRRLNPLHEEMEGQQHGHGPNLN